MIDSKEILRLNTMFKGCAKIFIALGDENRQKLITDIGAEEPNGINVSALATKSHLSRPAISHHLKVLRDCGFVRTQKVGTQIFYHLSLSENVNQLYDLLSHIQNVLLLPISTQKN